ncbi:class I SAM-dependent methyltransferase [Methylobacterium sp. J-068]|uniref:class I SAM-dependent methyltransferase n=1 Tax=Methylobacterium sp. J-068 TaxID=2836649 RepID=UPI001FBAC1A5|nr:class I SAM-dependent methyltransferase [Methylobacterium sp. J-068]MCJ2036507.1 class I SAM-dependent methyltransferase [Methylobacterium sp. J-068]
MATFKDHFSSHAAGYAAHRPTYPAALVDALAAAAPGRDLALDCGCGTGQLSVLLAARFARVVATDASAQQIANARPHPSVTYRTAPAERSGLPDASADLVTVAQAAHWLDLDAFYAEARRVARPGAILALVTYGVPHVGDAAAEAVVQGFYRDVLGSYWPPERRHVEDGYRGLAFPFAEIATPPLAIAVSWSLGDLIGYTETWSAVRALERAAGRAPMETFLTALAEAWGEPERRRSVRWPLSVRAGRL